MFSQLSSIPGLEQNQNTKNSTENNDSKEENVSKINEPDNTKQDIPEDIQTEKQLINKDSRYEKYLKMIHFGVPKEAVKLKMEQEGLNSSILE